MHPKGHVRIGQDTIPVFIMDIENLNAGQEFEELPETYTIFITEEDFFEKGKPVYRVERMNLDAEIEKWP